MTADQPLYNSRIINSYLNLIKKKYPRVDVRELLLYAEIMPYEVSDEGHWFTQRHVDRFHEMVTKLVGTDIAREAGRYAASGESIGLMGKYVLGMIGPVNAFTAIGKSTPNFTRSTTFKSRKIADNKVEITVTVAEGVEEKPYQCENRTGFFEAILMLFNYEIPVIEHPECLFKGDPCCRYIIAWERTPYARVRALRNGLIPPLSVVCATAGWYCGWAKTTDILAALAFLFLGCSYLAERLEKRDMSAALANLKESTDNLLGQIGMNYNNARMVNEVGQAISKQSDIDEVLENVIKALEKRLGYDRCVILLADAKKSRLIFRTGFGYSENQLKVLKNTSFNLTDSGSKGVFVVSFREQRSIFVEDFSEVSHVHSPQSISVSEKMDAQSFICCAIVCEGESLGVLAVDNMKSKKQLMQSDMSLLTGIAPVIGMSIRNAMYIERERRMAEQIRQSQKMEAVGQLAGGVAHDFNNLLTAIIGFVTLAQMKLDEEEPALKFLEQVIFAADRATNLTQGLLAFSRKQVNNPEPVDLNSIVSNIKKLLSRLISAEIELKISLSEQRLGVVADSGQIDQVLMNLVTNARDAMSGAGVLSISTSTVQMCENFIKSHGYGAVGAYAVLSVSDTGMGMDDSTMAHIFEPFFTTKEVGKGTGLGLAIVYGIVKQHDGYLEIHSEPGAGATFNVYLPLLDRKAVPSPRVETAAACYEGTETVLVAEDAPEVRKLTIKVLEQSGYQVIEATDGQDAVQKFSENREDVDLVILDVIMPKMNGRAAFTEMVKINPGTRVLFTSGYTPEDVNNKGLTFGKENFLAKPSTPQALLKKVREVLAA
ncbi:MAG: diguanylate cyclase [Geobacteraceae bacterium GWC2_58_44]|nr:MAG: diguanylate cyclase [Geobacteraceae bacterium GWC2_58_44]HBG07165.1 diguanylate cyclase [Geobacter sp.]